MIYRTLYWVVSNCSVSLGLVLYFFLYITLYGIVLYCIILYVVRCTLYTMVDQTAEYNLDKFGSGREDAYSSGAIPHTHIQQKVQMEVQNNFGSTIVHCVIVNIITFVRLVLSTHPTKGLGTQLLW